MPCLSPQVYLIYIEMLGHDTSWAQATAIQLCSDKNLAVKKVGAGRGQRMACCWRYEGRHVRLQQQSIVTAEGAGCAHLSFCWLRAPPSIWVPSLAALHSWRTWRSACCWTPPAS